MQQNRNVRHICSLVVLMGSLILATDARSQVGWPSNIISTDLQSQDKNPRQLPLMRMPGLSPDYVVGPGDELEITVVGTQQEAFTVRAGPAGEITIPFVGTIVVSGMTAEEIELAVATEYRDRQLVRDPQVLVFVSSYESRTVYALGEVDRPGEYSFSFQTTLMDMVFMVGGLDFTAARYGFLHRRLTTGSPEWRPTYVSASVEMLREAPEQARPGTEVIAVDLQPLKEGGVLEDNIVLRNGDVFYVPRRSVELLYVIGEVNRPGAFEMPEQQSMTAAQAIARAGGATRTAKMSEGMLVRQEPGGARTELPVDFAAVLRGEDPDFEVRPNDVIFVPTSNAKNVGLGVLAIVPRILTFGFLF